MTDCAIGVDVGGTKALAVVLRDDGTVVDQLRSGTPHGRDSDPGARAAEVVADQVLELSRRHGLDSRTVPIGLGLPGLVRRDGHLAFAPNLPSASGSDLGVLLGDALGRASIVAENDVNCAAIAEHAWGAGRGVDDFVMVTLGTGIGGGVVADGRLVRGRNGFAGEIGHMVVEARGVRCPCGARGCWERYASGSGLQRLSREAALDGRLPALVTRVGDPERVTGEDVTAAAADGLGEALAVVDRVGWWLALGLANLIAILDAGCFVVGGGLSEVAGLVLPSARTHLADLAEGYGARATVTIAQSAFGSLSGAVGAALVAFERAP